MDALSSHYYQLQAGLRELLRAPAPLGSRGESDCLTLSTGEDGEQRGPARLHGAP